MRPATATTLSTTPTPGPRAARKSASWVVLKAAWGLLCGLATCQAPAAPVVVDSTGAVIERAGVSRSPGGFNVIVADSAGGGAVMARLAAVTAKLPGLTAPLSDDARQAVWEKCVESASLSGATALLRSRMGAVLAHPENSAFQRQLIDETLAHRMPAPAHVGVFRGLVSHQHGRAV